MTSSLVFPRVLILSDEGPQTGTAGGLLLHRLFRGWPEDRLRVLARHVPTQGEPLAGVVYRRLLVPWHRFESSRWHRLKRSLRAWGLARVARDTEISRHLEGFTPDLVFCVMQHAQYYDSAAHYARNNQLPLVVAVHDINESFEPVYPWAQAAMRRRDGNFYSLAVRRLCISTEMEQHCRQIYGTAGHVLPPIRGDELSPRPIALSGMLRSGSRLTIGFVGNLGYGYGLALQERLSEIRDARVRIIIFGRPPGAELALLAQATDCCEFRGFVPASEAWHAVQRECDAVWLPYPLEPDHRMAALYRCHFPSKLPEYLALGMPVLVTGPAYATGVRWAKAHPTATATCPEGDVKSFTDLVDRLTRDSAWRMSLAESAVRIGNEQFSPERIRNSFWQHLSEAATRNGESGLLQVGVRPR